MKKILILCVLLLVTSNLDNKGTEYRDLSLYKMLQESYKITSTQAHKVIYLANKKGKESFPTKHDILAIMSIESTFKSETKSKKKASGLMQILYRKTHSDEDNVDAGVELLSKYRDLLKSEKAAIIAYNVGIGNYKKGIRNIGFYNKFIRERQLLKNTET